MILLHLDDEDPFEVVAVDGCEGGIIVDGCDDKVGEVAAEGIDDGIGTIILNKIF